MDEIASAILDSDLPSALQVTLLHVHRASENGVFIGTQGDIAEKRGVHRGTVSSQFKDLKELGWLKKLGSAWKIVTDSTERRDIQQSVDSVNSEQGFPRSSLRFSPKKVHSTPISPSLLTPSQKVVVGSADADRPPWLQRLLDEISWQAEPLPDDHPACWEYHPGEWEWEAAMYLLRGLQEHQVLHSGIDDSKPEGQIASKWADVFRRLHEKDGYGLPAIRGTLWWLINTENWWIQNVIQSGSNYALRSRDGDGAHKFDKLVQRARRYYEQRQRQRTDPDTIREGFAPDSEREPEPAGSSGDSIPHERGVEVSGFQW